MKAGGHGIKVINRMNGHDLSHSDEDALKTNVAKGAGKVKSIIIDEPVHKQTHDRVWHGLELKYETSKGTFLYCKVAGSDFKEVLEQLKTCKKQ